MFHTTTKYACLLEIWDEFRNDKGQEKVGPRSFHLHDNILCHDSGKIIDIPKELLSRLLAVCLSLDSVLKRNVGRGEGLGCARRDWGGQVGRFFVSPQVPLIHIAIFFLVAVQKLRINQFPFLPLSSPLLLNHRNSRIFWLSV